MSLGPESHFTPAFVRLLALASVTVLAVWVRLAPSAHSFAGPEFVPVDGDSIYHAQRMLEAAGNFPEVSAFDPKINWPEGAFLPWPAGFDLVGGALLRIVGATGGLPAPPILGLFPVLLGLAVVWLAGRLAARLAPTDESALGAGLAAAGLAALLPPAVEASFFGRIDHHVVEALVMAALSLWVLEGLTAPSVVRPVATRLRWELCGLAFAAAAVWCVSSGVLYVGLVAAVLLVAALLLRDRPALGSGGWALIGGGLAAAALNVPAVLAHGRAISYGLPSFLQPLLVAVAGGAVVLASEARRGGWWRLGIGVAVSLVPLAASVLAPAILSETARALRDWLLHRDPWLDGISEFQPLWRRTARSGLLAGLYAEMGLVGCLAPVILPAAVWLALRANRRRGAAFAAFIVALSLLAVLQRRFAVVLAPLLAVAAALVLVEAIRAACLRARWKGGWGWAAQMVPAGAVLALAASDPRVRVQLEAAPLMRPVPVVAAALDLRDGADARVGRGILAPWDWGHHLGPISGRPVLANGFGPFIGEDGFAQASTFLSSTPGQLDALMTRRDLGILVAGEASMNGWVFAPGGRGPVRDGLLDPEFMRAVPLAALLVAGSGIPQLGVPHIPHLLPRFACRQRAEGLAFPLPRLWTYERVEGARLQGHASAGVRVVAELPFRENGQAHLWRAWTEAGEDGRWAITLPFPSGYARPTVVSGERWVIRAGESKPVRLEVPEEAVRAGTVVEVPFAEGLEGDRANLGARSGRD